MGFGVSQGLVLHSQGPLDPAWQALGTDVSVKSCLNMKVVCYRKVGLKQCYLLEYSVQMCSSVKESFTENKLDK